MSGNSKNILPPMVVDYKGHGVSLGVIKFWRNDSAISFIYFFNRMLASENLRAAKTSYAPLLHPKILLTSTTTRSCVKLRANRRHQSPHLPVHSTMANIMDFEGFGSYSLAETTDLTEACQTPCKYVKDGVSALIPWHFYLLFAVMGGIFIGINVIFVLSLTRRFIQRVDAVLEGFATMIEMIAKGLENRPDEGDISAEELLGGTAYYPLAIVMAFIYLVDQILERLMVMWNAMIEGGSSTMMEIPTKESRLEVAVRELLMEWEKEDKDRADMNKRKGKGMVQEERKVAEICKVRNGKKSAAGGISGRVGGMGEGIPKDFVIISQRLLVILNAQLILNIEEPENCRQIQFNTQ